jgi:cytoskeleton-associated protein 5
VLVEIFVLGLLLLLISSGFSESVKMVTTSMSLPSKAGLKNNKHGLNDRGSNVGKLVSQVCVASLFVFVDTVIDTCFLTMILPYQRGLPARASVTMVSTQDPAQSQALFNIKDSNKVSNHQALQHLCIMNRSHTSLLIDQEERERRVLVRKFKFEEPRREQIDELKVCILHKWELL